MDTRIELADADKARLVWKAARVPKCGPLGDEAAAALGHDLDWAAQWRAAAGSTLPPRERERLKQIEDAATKLASLLDGRSGTRTISRGTGRASRAPRPRRTCTARGAGLGLFAKRRRKRKSIVAAGGFLGKNLARRKGCLSAEPQALMSNIQDGKPIRSML
jgi:hypothetical protein